MMRSEFDGYNFSSSQYWLSIEMDDFSKHGCELHKVTIISQIQKYHNLNNFAKHQEVMWK